MSRCVSSVTVLPQGRGDSTVIPLVSISSNTNPSGCSRVCRIGRAYRNAVERFSDFLGKYHPGFRMAFVTLLLEPWQAIKAGCLYFLGKKKHFNFFGLNPRAITADQAKKRPILLIHGNYHNQSGFLPMARYLMRQKIGPVYSVNLPSGGVTDKDYKIIQQKISEIKEQYRQYNVSSTKIDVVGHSRGGLLAHQIAWSSPGEEGRRYWSVCEDIGKVIKIGAVTGGENLYHIEKIDKSFKERLYEITAEHDCLVTARSLLDNSVSICSGHLGLLSSPETLRRVAQILAS